MLELIILLAGAGGLGVGLILGVIGLVLHVRARRKGGGSWTSCLTAAAVAATVVFGGGFALLASTATTSGAPTGDDYKHAMVAYAVMGLAPGLGLFVGSLIASRRPQQALPESED